MKWLTIWAAMALGLVACGDDNDNTKTENPPECISNADCPDGFCDLATGQCEPLGTNNQNNTNSQNNTTTTPDPVCGNGVVEAGEACDGDCPNECNNSDPCAPLVYEGSADDCSARCVQTTVTACTGGDSCCPSGCSNDNDADCEATCGNLQIDAGESCDSAFADGVDGACPRPQNCVAPDACTTATYTGSATTCDAACTLDPVTSCVSDDGCCPAGCDLTQDNDCRYATGEACTSADECAGEFCILNTGWVDGYCTGACDVDADCGPDGHCNGRACVATCTSNNDCRPGYECSDFFNDGTTVCAPATTYVMPGGACTSDDMCATTYFGATCLAPDDGFADGYCVVGCEVDADCPGASFCASTDTGGVCVPTCNATSCRDGYACFDYLNTFRNTCGPAATGTGTVGAACDVLQDCAGGTEGFCIESTDWVGGYCTLAPCTTNLDCATGSHCGFKEGTAGFCVDDCATQADCRAGFGCVDADGDAALECAPSGIGTGLIGDACTTVADCAGGVDAICINESQGWRSGYCSLGDCTTDTDCGDVNLYHCAFNDGQPGVCLKNCLNGADCRTDGYGCTDMDEDNVNECAPSATGTGLPGDACAGTWECAGGSRGFCIGTWPDGYCALADCISNGECGTGGHCGFVDATTGAGVCVDSCQTDADCRDGYGCYDLDADAVNECLPVGTRPVGAACDSFADCGGREAAACAPDPDFPGGYCVTDCTTTGVCDNGNVCVTLQGGSAYCFDACTTSSDCRADYFCGTAGGQTVCLP